MFIFFVKSLPNILPRFWHEFSYQLLRLNLGVLGLEICQLVPLSFLLQQLIIIQISMISITMSTKQSSSTLSLNRKLVVFQLCWHQTQTLLALLLPLPILVPSHPTLFLLAMYSHHNHQRIILAPLVTIKMVYKGTFYHQQCFFRAPLVIVKFPQTKPR